MQNCDVKFRAHTDRQWSEQMIYVRFRVNFKKPILDID